MQIYAFLDPEFWYIMLRELWPVLAVPWGVGVIQGWWLRKWLKR